MRISWKLLQDRLKSESKLSGPREAVMHEAKLLGISSNGSGHLAKIGLRSKLSASMFTRLLLPDLKSEMESLLGGPTEIEIEVTSTQECFPLESLVPDVLAESGVSEAASQLATIRFRERLVLNPALTFETFVETPENRFALSVMNEFSSFRPIEFSVVALHGPAGIGKSHLLHAAGNHAKMVHPSTRVKVVTGDEFITDFQSAISKKNMGDFRRRYRLETDLLLVDDLHSISRAKATQEEFFNLMNHIASTGRRMAITCDRPIDSLEGLEERIRSRLSGGLAIPMERPSAEGRVAILAIKLKRRGILLPENVLKDLSLSTEGCVRTLEGLVNRLAFMHRSGCLDAQSIRQMIKDVPVAPVRLTSSDIMNEVAKRYNLTLEDLRSKSRSRVQVNARRESMRRMKEELGLSLSEIGRLHLRDHSTVVHALRA